jgi:dTDP-4-amino-4,6-dideoxygalactose transaminase
VLGGEPAFSEPLHVGRPNIASRERVLSRLNGVFDRRWLSNEGPLVLELEERLAAWLGVKHCITVCNGTIGLELAIRALDLKGEVIVPSFTFVATAHALQWQDITPVFCDIRPDTHTIDPAVVERLITPKTTGIIGVHLWGQPCDVDALASIARARGLRLLFDAAHAFGCTHRGRKVGGFGEAEVFSFHATKVFNAAEGGAITTNDDELARRCRLMRNFGFTSYDQVDYIGTNGKMNELSAAMGLANFEEIDAFIAANRRNYERYRDGLAGIRGVALMPHAPDEARNHHNVVIDVDEAASGLGRDDLFRVLRAENVLARRYFWPGCHRMEPYKSHFPNAGLLLPVTERVAARVLSLPTGSAVTESDVATVCGVIRQAVDEAPAVRSALR